MIRNSSAAWGWPAIALHWFGAALIIVLLAHGWWMTHLAPRPDRLANYSLHAALGYDFLALLILRLLWRWLNPVPALEARPGSDTQRGPRTSRSMS
jgi:cytochrome b561